jgi:ankyrin repeat protein
LPIFDKLSVLFNLKDSPKEKREKLFTAVENRNVPAVEGWLASEKDAARWKDDSGLTALMVASQYGHSQIIDMLLDAGADINARDNIGRSAMAHAAGMGQQGIVKKLIGLGADTEGTYAVAERNGKTQIMQMIDNAAAVHQEAKREQLGGRIEVMKPLSLRAFKPAA